MAREVWLASDFTSAATTAKPLPASPARAASIVALSARRLVCPAIAEMAPTTEPMRSAASASERMVSWVRLVSPTADCAMPRPRVACSPISWIDPDNSSVAVTVASMRSVVSAEADDAEAMRASVVSAVPLSVEHVAVNEAEASLIASITSPMAPAKSAIAEFDQAAPGQYRLLGRLPVQGHGIGDVEADGLRYAPGLRGEPRRGKRCLRARASNAALST